jgi:hypothetical protein
VIGAHRQEYAGKGDDHHDKRNTGRHFGRCEE